MSRFFYLFLLVIFFTACGQSRKSNFLESAHAPSNMHQDSFVNDFRRFGFTLKTPCKLEDVSSYSKGDFLVNYGGVLYPNDHKKMVAYQLIVSRLPVGYRNLTKKQLENKVDEIILASMSNMKNVKSVSFGYEGYPGYVGETTHNGLAQKGVIFLKDNYTIALTVMTNDSIEAKFNAYTNGFKTK